MPKMNMGLLCFQFDLYSFNFIFNNNLIFIAQNHSLIHGQNISWYFEYARASKVK
jgi:hypothetical protein